jgi:predicted PurR-regulated permease PerM
VALLTSSLSESAQRLGVRASLLGTAALVGLLYFGRDFFVTLIISAIFAFILDPAVKLVMRLRLPRPAATGIVLGIALIGLYILGAVAWIQISNLSEDLPTYTSRASELWQNGSNRLDQLEKNTIEALVPKTLREQDQQIQQKPQQAMQARVRRRQKQNEPVQPAPPATIQEVRIHTDPKPFIATLYSYSARYFHLMFLASFVPFLVYFMLSWRDHLSKSVIRIFRGHDRYVIGKTWIGIGDATRAYVLGNFLLWVFLSSVSAIVFFFLGIPYWPLIGILSALFSLVPSFGLPLSVLPPMLAAVAIPNRFKIIVTAVLLTGALHLIAMNFLYAKIIGRRVRLNPLVVTVALMFWGLLWGGFGLLLAIPITAAVKTVCDNVEGLEDYGKLLGD